MGLHFRYELVREPDATHVQVQTQFSVLVQPIHVPPPQRTRIFLQPISRHRRPVGNLPSHRARRRKAEGAIGAARVEGDVIFAERVGQRWGLVWDFFERGRRGVNA